MSRTGITISVPVLAYKNWNISYFDFDEDMEEKSKQELKRMFPYKEDKEKVR